MFSSTAAVYGEPEEIPAHLLALEGTVDVGHRILNLGNGTGFSVREVVDAARLVTGCQIPAVESPRRAGDPPVLVASSDRIRAELGWVPQKPALEDTASDAWNWMRTSATSPDGAL